MTRAIAKLSQLKIEYRQWFRSARSLILLVMFRFRRGKMVKNARCLAMLLNRVSVLSWGERARWPSLGRMSQVIRLHRGELIAVSMKLDDLVACVCSFPEPRIGDETLFPHVYLPKWELLHPRQGPESSGGSFFPVRTRCTSRSTRIESCCPSPPLFSSSCFYNTPFRTQSSIGR